MSRVPTFARAALALLVIGACSEHLPPAGVSEASPTDASWPIDVRPVSDTCRAPARSQVAVPPEARIAYQLLTTAPLKELVDIVPQGGRLYVVERRGLIHYLSSDGKSAPVVLDIGGKLTVGYDSGLLSLAFHPHFASNGYVYVAMTVPHPVQPPPPGVVFQSVLARFQSKDGGLTIDPTTEKRLLVRDQPTVNHNGNKLAFGNDGYLYFAVGDGGTLVDPPNQSQDKNVLLGKVLRIDVDSGEPYGIPPTNPFAQSGGAPEVYAYGFRNPWRFSFDRVTGDLWLGDVGANTFEEIDRVVSGGNYGWPTREGPTCFFAPTCDATGLIDPVAAHRHDGTPEGAAAIIGGVVYRGSGVPSLSGQYVYADYVSSNWWAFDAAKTPVVPARLERGLDRVGPVSIALDDAGEIVFVTDAGGVYRVVAPPPATAEMPAKLSATGCVDKADPTKAEAGLFPYDVNVPQWMDGAVAERFLSVPAAAVVGVHPGGVLELPPGSVAMRTLRKESKLVETQLLLRRPDASWSAYTYAWSADQKDALLAERPTTIALGGGKVHDVRPQECLVCHNAHGQVTLGLQAGQLERGGVDERPAHSSLATLVHVGLIAAPIAPESYAVLPVTGGYDTEDRRSRAYLHATCSFCHDGQDTSKLDLRLPAPRPDAAACAILGSMRASGAGRMPPLGPVARDEAALRVLGAWIGGFRACP